MKPTLKVTKDSVAEFNKIIKRFKKDEVLVGIPEKNSNRKSDKGSDENNKINNAMLLAIANFGSPVNNIPPWPIMKIGIRNAKEDITEQFRKCAINTLKAAIHAKSGFDIMDRYYHRAGIIASQAIKNVINDQIGVPSDKPADSTIYAREHRKPTPFKGDKYWLVTGQMRNAITYVLKKDRHG